LPRARSRTHYPLAFNEPMNWVPSREARRDFSILSWAVPAVPWDAGAPPKHLQHMRLVTTERMIELPFAHHALAKANIEPPAQILEFGCLHSRLALELATFGYHVVGLDLKPYPFQHPNLDVVCGNLLTIDLDLGSMDAVTAISVVEHTGLERQAGYGLPAEGESDSVVMRRLKALLRPGGLLVLSVPYGRAGKATGYRVYDRQSMAELVTGWNLEQALYVRRPAFEYWVPSREEEMSQVDSAGNPDRSPFPVQGVALLALSKPLQ